ncbi:hypothetical protein G9444_1145 [Rhodococcus erythropolis]|uniref:Uncharacterized protein n=1 Tax=Rhodococcus erythropolis TaxID=1833 RepID=A0A6G9CNE9_RHOER|nr:hypothetical protein G9444_1145 [Rhodococcus erythropolis]
MNAPMNTNDASGRASGTPRIARAGTDTDRVGGGNRDRGAHVTDQRPKTCRTGDPHPTTRVGGNDPGDELPDLVAAVEEEDESEQRQQCPGEDLADDCRRGQGAAGQGLTIGLHRLDDRITSLADLILAEVQRSTGEPVLNLRDAGRELVGELGQPVDELLDDKRHDSRDQSDRGKQNDDHSCRAGNSPHL